jgi:hypothetical protein
MDLSLLDYLDEDACYTRLVELLHPDGPGLPSLRRAIGRMGGMLVVLVLNVKKISEKDVLSNAHL